MIIQISGAPGSGKSTFGIELKKIFKNIKILDLDDLFDNFINKNKFSIKAYQKYLDIIINKNKNIIFVGLNKDKGRSGALYDLKSDYNFYIKINIKEHIKRLFKRDFDGWLDWMKNRDKDILFKQLINDEKQVIIDLQNSLSKELSLSQKILEIENFNLIYKSNGYIFLTTNIILKKLLLIFK